MTSTADRLRPIDPSVQHPGFIFVGGKGGVGKTTAAAATAVSAAREGRRTLVVSVDPAPSLGDALSQPLGPAPRRVPLRRGSLHAVEVNAARALERWLAERREALERAAVRGTWLDEEDVARLLRLSLPGIDEMAAMFEIARLARTGRFDLVVVDTAPTGHTLRLLAMPETVQAIAQVFEAMQAKHRAMVAALSGGWRPDAEDEAIAAIDRDAREWSGLLRDPQSVHVHWVTLPEPMAVAETRDALAALAGSGIAVQRILVNRLTPPPEGACGFCRARRALESKALASLRKIDRAIPIAAIASRDREPRGVRALASIGEELRSTPPPVTAGSARAGAGRDSGSRRGSARRAPSSLGDTETRLLLFGGKGGVGKTTVAAAAALDIAARQRRRRVLLISTDPAHSLGDVFGRTVSDTPRTIAGGPANLDVRELDAGAGLRRIRARYAESVRAAFERLTSAGSARVGIDVGYDRAVMEGLIDLAPPGIDELAAVIEVTEALDARDGYDLVVMDTAPSGHALRLLEMPALVQDWVRALMSILLKYQAVVGLGELGAMLLKLSQGLGRLRELLADPVTTRFVVVARAAGLVREETSRLIGQLRRLRISAPVMVVNAVGRGRCRRCRREAAAERRELGQLTRIAREAGLDLVVAPVELPPPHDAASLRRWSRTWV